MVGAVVHNLFSTYLDIKEVSYMTHGNERNIFWMCKLDVLTFWQDQVY